MRVFLIIFLSLINQFIYGQTEFRSDLVSVFSLDLTIKYAPLLDIKSYTIDNNGNVRCIFPSNKGRTKDSIVEKIIKLDKKKFRQFKAKIEKLELWKLPEKLDAPDIADGLIYELNLSYNNKLIFLTGQNREQVDIKFKKLLELLNKIVKIGK